MKHFVWVSFDLGVKGDYEGLYAWLDGKAAKECGDSLACFWFEHKSEDPLKDLKKELKDNVELDAKKSRVYVIRLVKGKMKGAFIFGGRRNPPWAGFGGTGDDAEDSSNE
jgi:hypothetical protein